MSRIETERLILSLYTDREHDHFIRLLTDPVVMKYVDKGVLSVAQAESLWKRLTGRWYPQGVDTIWAVCAKTDGRYVGNASLRPRPEKPKDWEIGYYLRPEEWSKGFATEIACRLVGYAFGALDLSEVYATVDVENHASRRVLEKVGMELYREEHAASGAVYVYRTKNLNPPSWRL